MATRCGGIGSGLPGGRDRQAGQPAGAGAPLGEDLVAFRDSDGRIGLIDEFCPHRRVSLFFGRNEECGLRCVYHAGNSTWRGIASTS